MIKNNNFFFIKMDDYASMTGKELLTILRKYTKYENDSDYYIKKLL